MKILLLDDDVFLRDMYAIKFTERGDKPTPVSTGMEALSLLEEETFDVVVTDMVMPQMSGLDLLRKIKEKHPKLPCIVLSNQGESFDKDDAEKAGAVGYIVKAEYVPSEVVEKVHTILQGIAVS
ncbi:response regulator [Candidatus Kaiserbacteria bacterium]|nr:response regulator [Candidatus Kaiserbacteria bacterium]